MDLLDNLALMGRRYEPQSLPSTGNSHYTLQDLLTTFNRQTIYELTPYVGDKAGTTVRPDEIRKMKVSLLDDGISAIHTGATERYEVYKTPPSGDLAKVRIVAHAQSGQSLGEIRMLIGQRSFKHYFEEDPIYGEIQRRSGK